MKKIVCLVSILCLWGFIACSASSGKDVVKDKFPECFAEPMIGASSGARCEYDESGREWRITYWRGWGDCPAGCIHVEDTAWYKVDKNGKVIKCEKGFESCRALKPDEPIDRGKPTGQVPPGKPQKLVLPKPPDKDPAKKLDEKLYCEAHDDCFWYSCCQTVPMSKKYSKDHWRELMLDAPDKEACSLKCLHELPTPDTRTACVSRQCTAVPKDAPAIDPLRETVWVGRSMVIGQCEDPAMYYKNLPAIPGAAPPIIVSGNPGIKPGPEFTKWVEQWEKERFESDQGGFMCEACRICHDFARVYMLIGKDDLEKYASAPDAWKRIDR